MNDTIADRICSIAAGVFGVEPVEVTPTSTADDIETWDSFAQLNLMVALEDEYSIELDPDDMQQMSSIGSIADLVERHLAT